MLLHLPLHYLWSSSHHNSCSSIFCVTKYVTLIQMSTQLVPYGPIKNKSAGGKMMTWYRAGNKPLYLITQHCSRKWIGSNQSTSHYLNKSPMMTCLLKHICVTRNQWVNIPITFVTVSIYLYMFVNKITRTYLRDGTYSRYKKLLSHIVDYCSALIS